jgi:hypothetical protein
VRDHHVAEGTRLLVERTAALEAELLGDVDLHRGHVLTVPDRLEDTVGETQGEDVLHGLLAEKVIDPEDRVLAEGLVQRGVQRFRRLEVGAEGLLQDDPRSLVRQPAIAQHSHHRPHGRRRHRQVEQSARILPELLACRTDGAGELLAVIRRRGYEGEAPRQRVPRVRVELAVGALLERRTDLLGELPLRLVAAGSDDPEVLRHEAGSHQAEQAG